MRRLLVALAVLLAAGALWQRASLGRDARRPLPRGRLVDAGGFRLRIVPTGGSHPGPTVLLECGIGGPTSASWAWVQRGVEGFAPVVSYDRAGLGRSDDGPLPRDGRAIARELHTALANAGLPGPYVFVGHSFGGLVARIFAHDYPGDVAGVVLVESSHAQQLGRRGVRGWFGAVRALLRVAPLASEFGVLRAAVHLLPSDARRLPPAPRAEQLGYLSTARQWRGVQREFDSWEARTSPEAAACGSLGARPLVVLTAERSARQFPGWAGWQAELARLSSDGEQRLVPHASHASLVTDPDQSRAIVDAVRDVVAAVREHRPLVRR